MEWNPRKVLLFSGSFFSTAICLANPVLDNVASGNVSIQQTPNVTTVNQASQNAIINWQSFNIGANQATHFIQPAGGVALNRISPLQGASQVYGTLTATGKIILINPAGVYFGPNSFVNVGSLIATTSNLTDENFLKGIYHFDAVPGYNGSIVNAGTIQAAQHGLVALVGSNVTNDGKIQANLGHVVLASGDAFTMSFAGNDLIHFAIDKPAANAKVTNNGSVIADGGRILVTAKTASNVLDNIINLNGVLQAKSIYSKNGEIIISGDANGGGVHIKAQLIASGKNSGEKGGTIMVTGHDIVMDSGTVIDASGDLGGGKIIIGKDEFGHLANSTIIQPEVALIANAISGGNGGFIETSADHLFLGDNLTVNTSAPDHKNGGTWLIDPTDLFIGTNPTAYMLFGPNSFTGDPNISVSFLNINTLLNQLNNSNVVVQTTSGGPGSGSGNLTVATNINWNSVYSLTLTAFNNLIINNGVSITNSNPLANLTLIANNAGNYSTASGNGRVVMNGLVNMAGTVSIYTNPASMAYNVPSFSNLTAGLSNIYMLINNGNELDAVSDDSTLWDKNFALNKSIDLSGIVLNPIGNTVTAFTGVFDGLGHIVKNLNLSGTDNVGLFGVNNGTIQNIGVTGTVNGDNQVGLLVGDNQGTVKNAFSQGLVNGTGTNVGGLVGSNSGTLTDTQSYAAVNGDTNVGGLAGNNSGTITNALAMGNVVGNTNVGGLLGNNSNIVTASFWDTDSSGVSDGIGNGAGSVTAGCYGSACGGVDLTDASTFSNAGWNMSDTWGVIAGTSYPYLKVVFPNGPRIVTGQIGHFASYIENPNWAPMNQSEMNPDYSSFTADNIAQQQVTLAANGFVVKNNIYSGANGRYYTLENSIADNAPVIAYLTGNSNKANTITIAPTNGASLSNFNLALDTVLITDNGQLTMPSNAINYADSRNTLGGVITYYTPLSQNNVVAAINGLNNPSLLFTTNGNDIVVNPNHNIVLGPNTFYNLSGNITTDHGSLSSYGIMGISPFAANYNNQVTLKTLNGGNIYLESMIWETLPAAPISRMVNVDSANNIILHGLFSTVENRALIPTTASRLLVDNGLVLSAAYTNQSITTGSVDTSWILIHNLTILKGKWYQNNLPSLNTDSFVNYYYPYVNIIADFQLGDGNFPSSQVEFMRFGGGDGTLADPYIVNDTYGLQGIATSTALLNANYQLGGDDTFQAGTGPATFFVYDTKLWNDNKGFIPIGTLANPFNGTFDGDNQDPFNSGIWYLSVNDPTRDNAGIFGVTGTSAVIKNLMLFELAILGNNNVGTLVGINNGLLDNIEVAQTSLSGKNNVGTIAGVNNGTISNSGVYSNRTYGISNVGGITGDNSATGIIDQSYAANGVYGSTMTGGIAGTNSGLIRNSFWDTGATGQTLAASNSGGTLDHVTGGCLLGGTCAFGGTANLSDPATYLTAADGGFDLVSNSWDLTNLWAIAPGTSYPHHQFIYDLPSGGPPTVFSGKTNSPYQILSMVWGEASGFGENALLSSLFAGQTATGGDGSFYIVWGNGSVWDGDFVLLNLVGGNAEGSVGFVAKEDTNTGFTQNVTNIPLVATPNGKPANYNIAYTTDEITALNAGLPIESLYKYYYAGIQTILSQSNVYVATRSLYEYKFNLASVLGYATDEYQQGLLDEVKRYYEANNLVLGDAQALKTFQQYLDQQLMNRYLVTPVGATYCQ